SVTGKSPPRSASSPTRSGRSWSVPKVPSRRRLPVSHPADGTLRRLLDEPGAIDDAIRLHVEACADCRARSAELAAEASPVRGALAGGDAPIDAPAALGIVLARQMAFAGHPGRGPVWRLQSARFAPYGALAAVVAVLLLVTFTPVRSIGQSFLAIFEPHQFV